MPNDLSQRITPMRYELTLTLKPTCYRLSAKEQYRTTKDKVQDILKPFKVSGIVELTNKNNVHYHFMVELPSFQVRDDLINRIRKFYKEFGIYTCTQLVNETKWIEYLRKSVSEMHDFFGEWPWLRDDFNISGRLELKSNANGIAYYIPYFD